MDNRVSGNKLQATEHNSIQQGSQETIQRRSSSIQSLPEPWPTRQTKLLKLLLKLTLKGVLPVAAMVGLTAYSYYLKGGDPLGEARKISASLQTTVSDKVTDLADSVAHTTDATLKTLSDKGAELVGGGGEQVYQWTDADGVVHFSNIKPE